MRRERRESERLDLAETCFQEIVFWGRRPGRNPPSVQSSIRLIRVPAPFRRNSSGVYVSFHSTAGARFTLHHDHPQAHAIIVPSAAARFRFCAPAPSLPGTQQHAVPPPCGWSFLEIPGVSRNCSPAHRLSQNHDTAEKPLSLTNAVQSSIAHGLQTDIAPSVDPTRAQHLGRLGAAG